MTRALCILAIALALAACPHPLPPVPSLPDGATSDLFTFQTYDCTGMDTTSAQPYALTCADLINTGECLVNYVRTGVPPALMACAARDAETAALLEVAKGTASETTRARGARLRAWFWAESMTLRSAP